jgi:hypothetical protein
LNEREDQVGIEAMQEDVVQVIGPGFESGDPEIQGQGKPGQGDPESHPEVLEQGEDGVGVQTSDGQVELDIFGIVPIDEGEVHGPDIDKKGEEDGRQPQGSSGGSQGLFRSIHGEALGFPFF